MKFTIAVNAADRDKTSNYDDVFMLDHTVAAKSKKEQNRFLSSKAFYVVRILVANIIFIAMITFSLIYLNQDVRLIWNKTLNSLTVFGNKYEYPKKIPLHNLWKTYNPVDK